MISLVCHYLVSVIDMGPLSQVRVRVHEHGIKPDTNISITIGMGASIPETSTDPNSLQTVIKS